MLTREIVALVNRKLNGEMLTERDLTQYMDATIDDINQALSSLYPTFTSAKNLPGYNGDYTFFPERYIRSVVVVGTALKYYAAEEEGENIASTYQGEYAQGLFLMKRDHIANVPTIFRDETGGYLDMEFPYKNSYDDVPYDPTNLFVGRGSYHDSEVARQLIADNQELRDRITALEAILLGLGGS